MNFSRIAIWIMAGVMSSSTLAGCGSQNHPKRASISGNVTVNGLPLEEGVVIFIPDAGTQGPTSGAKILHGRYQISSSEGPVLGMHRVEVTARRTESGKPILPPRPGEVVPESSPAGETLIQYLPARYNTQSTLKLDVKAGSNRFDIPIELEKIELEKKEIPSK